MKLSHKVAELLENGWEIHDYFDVSLTTDGTEVKIPIGLQPGQFCREIDGIFLVYVGENHE